MDDITQDEILLSMMKWCLYNSIDLVWANSNSTQLIKKLNVILPPKYSKFINFASWSSDKGIHDKLKNGLDNVQAIDSDNDLNSFDEN